MLKHKQAALLLVPVLILSVYGHVCAGIFRKGPYLIYPNDNTKMTVLWQTMKTPKVCFIEWGEENAFAEKAEVTESDNTEHGHQFSYTITGLKPGTRVFYRITANGEQEAGSFRTAPPDMAGSLSFYAYGDTRSHVDDHNAVVGQILKDMGISLHTRQTFVIHTGDWVDAGTEEHQWDDDYFVRSQKNLNSMLRYMPVMGCRGNHEGPDRSSLFTKYLPYNYKEKNRDACYYSFDYGSAHFTVIDQYAGDMFRDGIKKGSKQYKWIKKDLAASKKPWKIALFHEPGWSAGGHRNDEDVQKLLQPLFEKYGVRLVLAGHCHFYSRCEVNGITHITTGGGGAPLYESDESAPHVMKCKKVHHFVRVDIDKDTMHITAIDKNGNIIDTAVIPKQRSNNHSLLYVIIAAAAAVLTLTAAVYITTRKTKITSA